MPSRVKKTQTKRSRPRSETHRNEHSELWGLGLAALGLFLGAVLYFGWNGGYVGGWLGDGLHRLIGAATYGLPVALTVLGALMVMRSALVDVRPFRVGVAVLAAGLMISLGKDQGGYGGQLLGGAVGVAIGATGSLLLGSVLILAGSLLLSGASLGAILRHSGRRLHRAATKARTSHAGGSHRDVGVTTSRLPRVHTPPVDGVASFPDVLHDQPPPTLAPPPFQQTEPARLVVEEPMLFDEVTSENAVYTLPDAGVLRTSPPGGDESGKPPHASLSFSSKRSHISGSKRLSSARSPARGSRATSYSSRPGRRSRRSRHSRTTSRTRSPRPRSGSSRRFPASRPSASSFRTSRRTSSRSATSSSRSPPTASPVSVWLGKDISGAAVWTDLARMPHLLIAGTTGSGKSGCLNALLTSVLLRATPDEVRMILIDPKKIELNHYESVPHLLTPVVSSPKEASAVLANCLTEMERRYERLSSVRARNINEANRAFRQRNEPTLPYILVVIDELADLMMVAPQAVEDAVIRLAQKSRAVGIHLVLATQRPSVDVITGMIKANVPSRIAFAVSSQTDSRVILDTGGAESLLGQGDMLFKPLGTSRLQRVQGAYVSEEEVALVVEQTRQREQELDESYLELPEVFANPDDADHGEFDPDDDPLLDKAIEIVVQTQTASVSLLQRRLRVGYTRAGRLIDMLERRGIISGYEGSKPRRVLIDEGQYHSYAAAE